MNEKPELEDKFRKEFLVRETNKKIIEQQFTKPDNPIEISKIKYEGESKLNDIIKNKSSETSLTTPTTEKSNIWIWILLIIIIVIALIIIFYFTIKKLTTPKSMKYNVKSEISPNVSLIPMG